MKIKFSESFIMLVEKKYEKMKKKNILEDNIELEIFGKLKIFINKKPEFILYSTTNNSDEIYIGSEQM